MLSLGFAPRLAAFYAALFGMIGIQQPFFPLWLQAKGLDAQAIGVVLAAPMVARVFAIPLAARAADHGGALRGTMIVALIAATIGYVAVGLVGGAFAITLVFALASAAFAPAMPLAETYALKGLGQRSRVYGPVRLWGSVAFIVGSFVAGYAADVLPARHLIWLITAAVALCALAAIALEPVAPDHHDQAQSRSALWLLTDVRFLAAIVGASLIQASHSVYYGFASLSWSQAGLGGGAIAALWALGVVGEIVLFAMQGRLPPMFGSTALIVAGGIAALLRWSAMALDPPVALLPLIQLLHGLSFGATHLGVLGYIQRAAPAGRGATAQGYYAIVIGLITAATMSLSGVLYAAYASQAYWAMVLVAAAGSACGAIAHNARHRAMP